LIPPQNYGETRSKLNIRMKGSPSKVFKDQDMFKEISFKLSHYHCEFLRGVGGQKERIFKDLMRTF
jgi:hypothetical protein